MIANACSEPMKYTMSTKDQTLMIDGFCHLLEGTVFLLRGFGHRFRDLGITDGTLLLCTNGISPKDGDLVVRMCRQAAMCCTSFGRIRVKSLKGASVY